MNAARFEEITGRYPRLRVAVVGDFFLDRYLEIDPSLEETSIETGLPVHNVVNVRAQAGAAGTIVNNLVALGVGEIIPVGFCGEDGEGYELQRALKTMPGVQLDHLLVTPARRTPVYCKPLVIEPGQAPRELSRLDWKNRTPTPETLRLDLAARVTQLARRVDAVLLMDQVEIPETGVVTPPILDAAITSLEQRPELLILADSRRGLANYPAVAFKMNASELRRMTGKGGNDPARVGEIASSLADRNGRRVFVTMAELGIVGATPGAAPDYVPAHPVRGLIDVVGAGDAVTSNLAAALAAGAGSAEAMSLAMAAASVVVHKLGTTGTATVEELKVRLGRLDGT